jgi:poly [ADP-ribose] polymerase
MATLVRIEKRIMTDCVEENHNKFWTGELYDNGMVITRWGRVGDAGQFKEFPGAGSSFLEKKLREKEGKGYRVIDSVKTAATNTTVTPKTVANASLRDVALKQIKSNNPIVAKLIDKLVRENAHSIMVATGGKITYNDTTGLFTTATGDVVSQATIDSANAVLEEIADLVAANNYSVDLGRKTNDYLMLIPTEIGRRKLDVREFWDNLSKVQAQKQILDSLQASLVSATSQPVTTRKTTVDAPEQQVFDCQLHLIDDKKEIDRIRSFYRKTNQSIHACSHLDVKTVYEVVINTVNAAFDKDGAKMTNIWELWHGTRVSNLLSILKGGLIIPPSNASNVTGRMFGNGIYASDQSTKALNYAYGYWGGGKTDNNCFMFLLNMAMGNYHVPRGPFSANRAPAGYDSTFAQAGKSSVQNNEMIVYRTSQVKLSRLVEFSPKGN